MADQDQEQVVYDFGPDSLLQERLVWSGPGPEAIVIDRIPLTRQQVADAHREMAEATRKSGT